ncbi:dihydrofolate reductase incomplete domain containing protein [Pandoravirus japonicus]|uniref:Dihydrofolate reductase incomplete domain containing protein n=1 Tax=Pandoravirus japonicus TaxID=2823154 RepID=A0A811BP49_9VIRU|nr:dihydrofolate reductase incomplete domain containing protein [Pandoravirus japonicus]
MQTPEAEGAQTIDDAREDLPAVHIVVCTDSHDTIAVDGALPWIFRAGGQRASLDALIQDAPVVVGSHSTSAFGGALPSSRVIILSRGGARPVGAWSRAHLAQTPEDALAMCAGEPVLYVLGGASTFAAFMPRAAVVHRIVVTGHDARPWPPEAAVAYFPWLGRAGGKSTVCGPIVPGREGGCRHQVRSDTLAPYDPVPPPAPAPTPVDPFAEDPDLQQAMMLSFYEHATQSTAPASVCSHSTPSAGSAATIASKSCDQAMNTDDQDWCVYDGGDDDDDWWIADDDDDDAESDRDKEGDDDGNDGDRDDISDDPDKDVDLSLRRATLRADPARPPNGCMVTLLGRHNMALAGAVIARLDRDDLLSLWRTSPGARAVLVDVLTTGSSSPCSGLVRIESHHGGAETTIACAVQVCPQDEPRRRRTGAAWLWLDVLPRLQSKCTVVEQMLARPAAYSSRAALVDYIPGTLERIVAWASATRCGAVVNACLAIGDSMSAASTAYNWSGGFVKPGASAGAVSMWLADAMGAEDGAAADLATTDVWLPAIGLATAAGRLRCELLLSLARRIAACNIATRRRFADAGRRAAQPGHPDALACVASARLILALLRGLAQTRHALDPPMSTETGGDSRDDDDDDERVARFLERVCDVGVAGDVACIAHALDAHESAGIALAEVCCRLRDMAACGGSRRARAAGKVLARVFAIVSPIDCDRGLRQESWTMRVWPALGVALAKAGADSFWMGLHPEPDPASALAAQGRDKSDVSSTSLVGHVPATGGDNGAADCAVGSDAAVQTGNNDDKDSGSGGLDLVSLFEHEIDLCTEVIARLPPWDLIALATASLRVMRSVWVAVCRASLDAGDARLAGIACAGTIGMDGGLSVTMGPNREFEFGHVVGTLMLACHRMPRMEMMADDVEALAMAPNALDGDHAGRLWALQYDPNLPAMLADTVAHATRLGCGAVLARCLRVARRMEGIVRRRGHTIARSSGFGSWLNDQMCAVHRTPPATAARGAWLPVAALAYIAGRERSLVLVSAVCGQINASLNTTTYSAMATTFWGAGGRRVILPKVEGRATMDPACRIALVLVACLWGMSDRTGHPQHETDRGADDAFLLGLEPLVEFLDSPGAGKGEAQAAAPPAATRFDDAVPFMRGFYAPREANAASLCLIARFLVAPPGRPVPADSVRAHIANLLVRAASRASFS